MKSFETTRTDTGFSSWSQETKVESPDHESPDHKTSRPLRNNTFYGRHSNDWLFGSIEVRKSVKNALARKKNKQEAYKQL